MNYKILCTVPNFRNRCVEAVKTLENQNIEIIEYNGGKVMTKDEILEYANVIDGAIIGCDEWDESIFTKCKRLRTISRFGIGVDNIDLDSAKKHGVKVSNARGINSDSVAEATIMFALAVLRNLINLDYTTKSGEWVRYSGHTLHGKKYGLVGFGAIAQYVAKLICAFDVEEIIAYDAYPDYDIAEKLGVRLTSFDELIKTADVISLHVPGTTSTFHMIDASAFSKMKSNAVIVNVARGPVVDQSALYDALKNKSIAGAGIDVFEIEPTNKENPLFSLYNIVVMPHQAADTSETFAAVGEFAAQNIVKVLKHNEVPDNWVNE